MTDPLVAGIGGFMCGAVFGAGLVLGVVRYISSIGRAIRLEQEEQKQVDAMVRLSQWDPNATPVTPTRTDGWD